MYSKYFGEEILKNIKKVIRINLIITHYCNFNCMYCISQKNMKNKMLLSVDEYNMFLQNIYTKFKDYEYIELTFNGGEPFTHPHIYEFIRSFLDLFLTNGWVKILTNGCSEHTYDVLRKFNNNDIQRIQLTSSYHSSEISIEDYISRIKTYYDTNIHNHIRILLSEYNQYNVFEQYDILRNNVPNWIVSIKPILIDNYTLITLPEEYMKKVMECTYKSILYDTEHISVEQIFGNKKYTNMYRCICFPRLFFWLNGTYVDRFCKQQVKHIQSDIFKKNINIQMSRVLCNQLQCLHQCDYYTVKYFC